MDTLRRVDCFSPKHNNRKGCVLPPPGLKAVVQACSAVYPDQQNPLQVTAVVKYWLGGPDPLDYVSMYSNKGDPATGVPPHWHYVTFGLSDLHGDGRVHDLNSNSDLSGFGFELTFRLKKEAWETSPPTWPASVLQSLARYVFQSENTLCAGDHVSWHSALDGGDSRIQHMLMAEDPQLGSISTPHGFLSFIQVVGVCYEELRAAQHWNGPGVLDLLTRNNVAGGRFLVTDMRRGESLFELDPSLQEAVELGIEEQGSNLSGVSAKCYWDDIDYPSTSQPGSIASETNSEPSENLIPQLSHLEEEQIKEALRSGLNKMPDVESTKSFSEPKPPTTLCDESLELKQTKALDGVHLKFNHESGSLLPLALRGRLKHGRHFTFKNILGDIAITLVSESVTGAFVNESKPYVALGPWLQVLLPEEFLDELMEELESVSNLQSEQLPKLYRWPSRCLALTILPEQV